MAYVRGTTKDGNRVFYTGKAGQEFVSTDYKQTFFYYSIDGALNRAAQLNEMTPIHGVHFTGLDEIDS